MSERKMNTDQKKNTVKDHERKKIGSRLANQSSKAGFNLLLVIYWVIEGKKKKKDEKLKFELLHRNINTFAAMLKDCFSSRSVIDRGLLVYMTE